MDFTRRNLKRRSPEICAAEEDPIFALDELNQDLLEKVLSWLPTSTFSRTNSVCKRWKSIANSATFKLACSQVPSREPWYFMVDSQIPHNNQQIIYDSSENNWKKLNQKSYIDSLPVAASGALLCFQSSPNQFIISNPVTGMSREINHHQENELQLRAIAMVSRDDSYKLVLVSGESSTLSFKVYNSKTNQWGDNVLLTRKINNPSESITNGDDDDDDEDDTLYFLSKCGNVVSSNLQRTPCKQYSSIIIDKDGEESVYFLSSTGAIIVCDLTHKCYYEYPSLLPISCDYSIDLVECGGEVYSVVLSDFLESTSLRVWKYDEITRAWHQIAVMPPALSHQFYGEKFDINCSASGDEILVCLSSAEQFLYFSCNLGANKWIELPNCNVDGKAKKFVCAFSFEPRIEAVV